MMMSKIQLNVIFTHTSLSAMVGYHANSKSFHQSLAKELQTDCINIGVNKLPNKCTRVREKLLKIRLWGKN